MQTLTETDAVSSGQPKRRRVWLYPIIGAAAVIALLFSVGVVLNNRNVEKPDLVAEADTVKVKERPIKKEESKDIADTVKKVKEILRMSLPPRHYMAKQRGSGDGSLTPSSKKNWVREPSPDPEVTDANELAERAIAEEERRLAMEMMAAMDGSPQTDYQEMTREIRQRGERMTRQVEMAINDE